MAKIVIEVPQGELEIDKAIGFGAQYSVGQIQDPTKRSASYSKTISLPGTKNNNILLGNLFDINSDFTFFNPNIKTPAKIIVDSTTIMDGSLQLLNIIELKNTDLQGNQIIYEVKLEDVATDFFSIIGDDFLTELDFSEFDHTYAFSSITATWLPGRTSDDGFCYPMLFNNSDLYLTSSFKPAIYHKAYLEKIATAAGFSLGGTFMSNTIYEKEIIPYNGVIPVLSAAEYQRRLFKAGMSSSAVTVFQDASVMGGINTELNPNQQFIAFWNSQQDITELSNDTTNGNFDPNGHWNPGINKWTTDRNGSYNIRGQQSFETTYTTLQTVTGVTNDGGFALFECSQPHNLQSGARVMLFQGFSAYTTGLYHSVSNTQNDPTKFRLTSFPFTVDDAGTIGLEGWTATYTQNGSSQNPVPSLPTFGNGNFGMRHTITAHKNGNLVEFASWNISKNLPETVSNNNPQPFPTYNPTFHSGNSFSITQTNSIDTNKYNISLLLGDEITFKYRNQRVSGGGSAKLQMMGRLSETASPKYGKPIPFTIETKLLSGTTTPTNIFNEANSSSITDGDPIGLNNYIPKKIKKKDILVDIIKRYNLYISIDPDNDKKLILDSRDDFYAKGASLNWTKKKHYSNKDKIQLLSELQNKEMLFTYKKGDDDWNKNYSLQVDEDIYGQKLIEFTNEFLDGENKVETPFSPTMLVYNSLNKIMVVPAINSLAPKSTMRVLYFAGNTPTINNGPWKFRHIDGNVVVNTILTEYPYAGHYDNPYDPVIDINFGEVPFEWYSELNSQTNNTLYNNYWRNYVNQIAEGKMVTSKFHLTEVDIGFIKNNLNATIFVKDSYYNINIIQDYDPTNSDPTTVELIKIIDGVPFTEVVTDSEIGAGAGGTGNIGPIRGGVDNPGGGGSTGIGLQTGFDTSNNDTQSGDVIISGPNNSIGKDSNSTIIQGSDNRIEDGVNNSGILGGTGNTINPNISRSWIIGANDKIVTESDVIFVGDVQIKDGRIIIPYNNLDGGENLNVNQFPTYPINIVDGGEDSLRGSNFDNVENLYDGNA